MESNQEFEQLYITHCSYATSFLHQRDDEDSRRTPFEFSTRAGSLPREQAHQWFQKLGAFAYYDLFRDFPGDNEELRRLQPSEVPSRFAYYPNVGAHSLIVYSSYRGEDTSWPKPRTRCYFAHLLVGDSRAPALTKDVLTRWASPSWKTIDEGIENPALPRTRLQALKYNQFISDQVFLSFLSDESIGDSSGVIPERWRQRAKSERVAFFVRLFDLFLGLDVRRQEALEIVAEPQFAAIMFYGLMRLLPDSLGVVGFSTYEDTTRSHMQYAPLLATVTHDPSHHQLNPSKYTARDAFVDTFKDPPIERNQQACKYAASVVAEISAHGGRALRRLDELFAHLPDGLITNISDLQCVHGADSQAERLLNPASVRDVDFALPNDEVGRAYLISRVNAGLSRVVGKDGDVIASNKDLQRTYLHIIAAADIVQETSVVAKLTEGLSDDDLKALVQNANPSFIKQVLFVYARMHRKLPDWKDFLWSPGRSGETLAAEVLKQVEQRLRQSILQSETANKDADDPRIHEHTIKILASIRDLSRNLEEQEIFLLLGQVLIPLTEVSSTDGQEFGATRLELLLIDTIGAHETLWKEIFLCLSATEHDRICQSIEYICQSMRNPKSRQLPERIQISVAASILLNLQLRKQTKHWARLLQATQNLQFVTEQNYGVFNFLERRQTLAHAREQVLHALPICCDGLITSSSQPDFLLLVRSATLILPKLGLSNESELSLIKSSLMPAALTNRNVAWDTLQSRWFYIPASSLIIVIGLFLGWRWTSDNADSPSSLALAEGASPIDLTDSRQLETDSGTATSNSSQITPRGVDPAERSEPEMPAGEHPLVLGALDWKAQALEIDESDFNKSERITLCTTDTPDRTRNFEVTPNEFIERDSATGTLYLTNPFKSGMKRESFSVIVTVYTNEKKSDVGIETKHVQFNPTLFTITAARMMNAGLFVNGFKPPSGIDSPPLFVAPIMRSPQQPGSSQIDEVSPYIVEFPHEQIQLDWVDVVLRRTDASEEFIWSCPTDSPGGILHVKNKEDQLVATISLSRPSGETPEELTPAETDAPRLSIRPHEPTVKDYLRWMDQLSELTFVFGTKNEVKAALSFAQPPQIFYDSESVKKTVTDDARPEVPSKHYRMDVEADSRPMLPRSTDITYEVSIILDEETGPSSLEGSPRWYFTQRASYYPNEQQLEVLVPEQSEIERRHDAFTKDTHFDNSQHTELFSIHQETLGRLAILAKLLEDWDKTAANHDRVNLRKRLEKYYSLVSFSTQLLSSLNTTAGQNEQKVDESDLPTDWAMYEKEMARQEKIIDDNKARLKDEIIVSFCTNSAGPLKDLAFAEMEKLNKEFEAKISPIFPAGKKNRTIPLFDLKKNSISSMHDFDKYKKRYKDHNIDIIHLPKVVDMSRQLGRVVDLRNEWLTEMKERNYDFSAHESALAHFIHDRMIGQPLHETAHAKPIIEQLCQRINTEFVKDDTFLVGKDWNVITLMENFEPGFPIKRYSRVIRPVSITSEFHSPVGLKAVYQLPVASIKEIRQEN